MNKKLLIINKAQFGYHIDTYKYCENLNKDFDITYIGFNMGIEKLTIPNVKVIYVSSKGHLIIRGIRFLLITLFKSLFHHGLIFVVHFSGSQLFRPLNMFKKMILDIRTLSVSDSDQIKQKYNKELKENIKYYQHITVISEGIKDKLNLKEKFTILPLGADIISNVDKNWNTIKMLYVGTLSGRELEKTILGLRLLLDSHPEIAITYDIVGDGFNDEINQLRSKIEELNLNNEITLHGRIPHNKLKPYFDKCNVGISFIPLKEHFQHQPPTKSFEYILSGLFCLATNTIANRQIINKNNGMLIDDNPKDFCDGLNSLIENSPIFNSKTIRQSAEQHTWNRVIKMNLLPLLKNI